MTTEPANLIRVDFQGDDDSSSEDDTLSVAWRLFVTGPAKRLARLGVDATKAAAKEFLPDPGVVVREIAFLTTAPLWRSKKEFRKAWDSNPRLMWQRIGPFSIATFTMAYVLFRIVEGTKARISPGIPTTAELSRDLKAVL